MLHEYCCFSACWKGMEFPSAVGQTAINWPMGGKRVELLNETGEPA